MGQMRKVSKNNTQKTVKDGVGRVILHGTEVVYWDEKVIRLNSGGWKTITTKARMTQASNEYTLGYRVSQKDGSWFVTFKGKTIPFMDDMTLER